MEQSNLINYLKSFQQKEWALFLRFLKSPYHNNNQQVIVLVELLRKFYPEFDHPKLNNAFLQKKLESKNRTQFDHILYLTRRLVEQFWQIELLKNKAEVQNNLNLKIFEERRLDKAFDKEVKAISTRLLMQPYRDFIFHEAMFVLNKQIFFHPKTDHAQIEFPSLSDGFYHLKEYQKRVVLIWEIAYKNWRKIKNIEINETTKLTDPKKTDILEIDFLKAVSDYLDKNDETVLFNLIGQFQTLFAQFRKRENLFFTIILINGLAKLIRKGDGKAENAGFDLYKIGLEQDLFLENGQFSPSTYLNIISLACVLRKFDWLVIFMNSYAPLLPPRVRTDTKFYGKGYFYFHQGLVYNDHSCFEKAIKLFQRIESSQFHYKHRMRSILVRCYFELYKKDPNSVKFIYQNLENFTTFLKRNTTISASRKEMFFNFANWLKKITQMLFKKTNRNQIVMMKQEIEISKNVFQKKWLIKKVEELIE